MSKHPSKETYRPAAGHVKRVVGTDVHPAHSDYPGQGRQPVTLRTGGVPCQHGANRCGDSRMTRCIPKPGLGRTTVEPAARQTTQLAVSSDGCRQTIGSNLHPPAGSECKVPTTSDPLGPADRNSSRTQTPAREPAIGHPPMPLVIPFLVFTAFAIVVATVAWAWVNGTLAETPQERVDHQFESIVRRLSD